MALIKSRGLPKETLSAKVPPALKQQIVDRARVNAVTVSDYVAQILAMGVKLEAGGCRIGGEDKSL